MKYIKFSILLFSFQLFAQNTVKDSLILNKKHEVKFAPISLLATNNFFVGYEYFANKDFSFGLNTHINLNKNSFEYIEYNNKSITSEISPFVRYSLSKKQNSFFYLESYLNYNTGEFRTYERLNDEFGNGYYIKSFKKYSDIGLGFGTGYKVYLKKTIGIDFNIGLSRNFFNDDSIDVLPKGNILLSYRF